MCERGNWENGTGEFSQDVTAVLIFCTVYCRFTKDCVNFANLQEIDFCVFNSAN